MTCGPGDMMLEMIETFEELKQEKKMINGIKPKLQTTTKLGIKPTSFDGAMGKFCDKLKENCQPEIDKFNHMKSVKFGTDGGVKYIKVKSFTDKIDTDYETGKKTIIHDDRGSIHCFVEKTTGDIYKPATWRAPFTKGKNCVRGNIYDKSTFSKTDMHGGWLYAK